MAVYLTGKLTEKKQPVAFKLYNSETQTSSILSKEDVKVALQKGYKIIGLRLNYNMTYQYEYMEINTGVFHMSKLAQLKGNGEIEEDSENSLVVIGRRGFKEEEQYILVDSQDQLYTYSKSELTKLLKEGKQFIGVHLSRGVPALHPEYNIRMY